MEFLITPNKKLVLNIDITILIPTVNISAF